MNGNMTSFSLRKKNGFDGAGTDMQKEKPGCPHMAQPELRHIIKKPFKRKNVTFMSRH